MSHIETGNTKLSLPVLVAIAESLNVQTDELIYGTPKITKTSLNTEITNILTSCTVHDTHILLDAMKAIKIALEKYNGFDDGNNNR